ncbi:hypothetical protein AALP_AA1G340300 [Arabis alpina]|uniref:DUF287 domain-containing protein n=1 Tax=Arabis alpina TaxID=50452 RepID=A0A087HSH5_ARAAL|nr:hypothetical protein AALP_AA1G340300 [Arabis alpina]
MAKIKWTKAKKKKEEKAKDGSPPDPISPVVEEQATEQAPDSVIDACSDNVEERVVRDGEEEKIKDGEDIDEEDVEEEDGDEASDGEEEEDGDDGDDGDDVEEKEDGEDVDEEEDGDEASDGNEASDGDEEEEDVQSIDAMVCEDESEPMQPLEMWFPNSDILEPTLDELPLMLRMMETGEEDDYIDPIVDGWKRRLVMEKNNIWFEDLLKKDVDGRKNETKAIPLYKRKGKDKKSVDVDVKEMILAGFKELGEKMTSMEAKDHLFKWVEESMLEELEDALPKLENIEIVYNMKCEIDGLR